MVSPLVALLVVPVDRPIWLVARAAGAQQGRRRPASRRSMLSRKAPPFSRAAATTIVATLAVLLSRVAVSCARTVSLSNVQLPLDQHGNRILTGEANVLKHNGAYYFYFNDWGSCPGVDCCGSSGGCASCCFDDPPYPIKTCQNPCKRASLVPHLRTSRLRTHVLRTRALTFVFAAPRHFTHSHA